MLTEQFRLGLAAERAAELELQMRQDGQQTKPLPGEPPAKKKLKRELKAEALARLEAAARTLPEFENVIAWWYKPDANRKRRERYHEVSRSGDDVPPGYGAAKDGPCFPDTLNDVLEKQMQITKKFCFFTQSELTVQRKPKRCGNSLIEISARYAKRCSERFTKGCFPY